MYTAGTTVAFQRMGCPFIGRVMRDDPSHERALLRIVIEQAGSPQPHSMITAWVKYSKIGTS